MIRNTTYLTECIGQSITTDLYCIKKFKLYHICLKLSSRSMYILIKFLLVALLLVYSKTIVEFHSRKCRQKMINRLYT